MKDLPHSEDWELCPENAHPLARALLTQPWYYDCSDDNSPFGNDTGADTLASFSEALEDDPNLSTKDFISEYLDDPDMPPAWHATTNDQITKSLKTHPYGIHWADDSVIAIAFAQGGRCRAAICTHCHCPRKLTGAPRTLVRPRRKD